VGIGTHWIAIALLALGAGGAEGGPTAVEDWGARVHDPPRMLFPILERGRWGFIDSTGRVAVPPRYEGTVAVEIERKSGALPPRSARLRLADLLMSPGVGPESTVTLGVQERGTWGVIDQHGDVVGRLRFDEMRTYSEGLAAVRTLGQWGFVDVAGRLAIPAMFDDVERFSGGLCVVTALGMRAVIDVQGRFVLNPRFELVVADDSVFHDNRAVVGMEGKMGYANRAGSVVVPALYDRAHPFSEGRGAVMKDGSIGYVDTSGRVVIAPRFDSGEPFEGGLARVMVGELYGLIDRTGAYVARPVYNDISSFDARGLAIARRGRGTGTLDRSGRWRQSYFEEVLPVDDSLSVGRVGGRTGVVRRETGIMIRPFPWSDIEPFSEGLAAVRKRAARFGFSDVAGNLVIPPRFTEVNRFRHGLCKVAAGDTLGYISRTGAWVWFGRFPGYRRR
jgi:hypothetical protein